MSQKPKLSSDEYVSKLGAQCPFCGGESIVGGEINIDAGCASQEVSCHDCYATWQDVYNLVGYDNAKQGE